MKNKLLKALKYPESKFKKLNFYKDTKMRRRRRGKNS